MKVILKEEVTNLGEIGEIVNVAPGYARNFLIPKGFAAEADTKNVKAFEHQRRVIQEKAAKLAREARDYGDKLSQASLTFKAKAGEEEKLFGSVTSKDIADALKAQGFEVDRRKILLEEPIKRLGAYSVDIKVGYGVTAPVTVQVVAE